MSSSPTPSGSPSPLTIGRTFLKQYYHVLTTSPDMIYKFYRPSSVLSHGEGSNPTTPVSMESLGPSPAEELKDRFFSWADSSADPVRFELEHGAIDAQESVNGGVLLVVTGHMYLGDFRKSFCHTFFLNVFSAENSKKRQYYVHNDVLRFLKQEAPLKESALTAVAEEDEAVVEETPAAPPVDVVADDVDEKEEPVAPDPVTVEKEEPAAPDPVAVEKEEPVVPAAPVAVEKEEPAPDVAPSVVAAAAESPPAAAAADESYEEGVEESKEDFEAEVPEEASKPAPKPPPGSWASLVASNSGAPAPATPTKLPKKKQSSAAAKTEKTTATKDEKPPKKDQKESDNNANNNNSNNNNSSNSGNNSNNNNNNSKGGDHSKPQRGGRRDPDCTLVIKHVPDGTKEADVRLVFEPFAVQTNTKIVGITVSQRGLAFVDYDSAAPVLAALEKKEKFSLNGKSVDIDQKTNDNRNRGRNNNNNNNRSNGQRNSGGGGGQSNNNNNQRQRNNNNGRGGGGGRNGNKGGGGR